MKKTLHFLARLSLLLAIDTFAAQATEYHSDWGNSPWLWTEGSRHDTIHISNDLDLSIDIDTDARGSWKLNSPKIDYEETGGIPDLLLAFDPDRKQGKSPITTTLTFSQPVFDTTFLITDIDSSGTGSHSRNDEVVITTDQGDPVLEFADTSVSHTFTIDDNAAHNTEVDSNNESNDDTKGSVLVHVPDGATTITIVYNEISGNYDPRARGIGIVGGFVVIDSRPPVAHNDSKTTYVNTPVTVDALHNDTDPDSDPLTITKVAGENISEGQELTLSDGTKVKLQSGKLKVTPKTDSHTSISFPYTISDGHGGEDDANVNVTIKNRPPVAHNDSKTTYVNTPVTVDALHNDTDPDSDPLTITKVAGENISEGQELTLSDGTKVKLQSGKLKVTPKTDSHTSISFPYTISDGHGGEDDANVNVTIKNRPPVAHNDSKTTYVNTPVTVDALHNDTDPDSDPLTITKVAGENISEGQELTLSDGTKVKLQSGKLKVTPKTDSHTSISFPYTISDGHGGEDDANVNVTIKNRPPVAHNDSKTTYVNTPVTVDALHNDTDPDSDPLTITKVAGENISEGQELTLSDGTKVKLQSGKLKVTPKTDSHTSISFPYTISDGHGGEDDANVNVTIKNRPPVAHNDSKTTYVNTPVTVDALHNDTDPDSDPLTITKVAGENISEGQELTLSDGTKVKLQSGKLKVTPKTDSHTSISFPYTISDGHGGEDDANVNVTIKNRPPVAHNDSKTTYVNTPVTVDALHNDTDPDSDPLTITKVAGENISEGQELTLSDGTKVKLQSGKLKVTPKTDSHTSISFPYTISDGHGGEDDANVNVTIKNRPPVAHNDSKTTYVNTPVTVDALHNDTDPDSDPLTITKVAGENISEGQELTLSDGTKVKLQSGKLKVTPKTDSHTSISFPYTISDGHGGEDDANVNVTIKNRPPVAHNDSKTTYVNTPVTVDALHNDTDPDSDPLTITKVAGENISEGQELTLSDGTKVKLQSGKLKVTPKTDSHTSISFPYTISDGHGGEDDANVNVTIKNRPPVAHNDSKTTYVNTPVTVDALHNDTDPDSDPLTITKVAGENISEGQELTLSDGTKVKLQSGKLKVTPKTDSHTSISFPYTISDGHGGEDDANVNVTIKNRPPVAHNDSKTTYVNTPVTVDALHNDTDPDSDPLTITKVAGENISEGQELTLSDGTKVKLQSGKLKVTPKTDSHTSISFPYTISDGHGGEDDANVNVTIKNRPPVAHNDSKTTYVNTPVTVDALHNDTDPDSDPLTITKVAGENISEGQELTLSDGTKVKLQSGKLKVTPKTDSHTSISFPYTISDGHGGEDDANVNVTIKNRPPVAHNDSKTTYVNTPVTVDALHNDTDPDSDPLTITKVAGENISEGQELTLSDGTKVKLQSGKLKVTPKTDSHTSISFPYTISDGHGGEDDANVNVTIKNRPPVAHNDSKTTYVNTPVTVDALHNDTDPDSDPLTITKVAGENISEGQELTLSDGTKVKLQSGKLKVTPKTDSHTSISFPYTISDGHGGEDDTNVNVTIKNRPPVAQDDDYAADEDTNITLTPLAEHGHGMDSDPDGDNLTIISVNGVDLTPDTAQEINVDHGVVHVAEDGMMTFEPEVDYNGTVVISYTIGDDHGGNATANENIVLSHVDNVPDYRPTVTITEGQIVDTPTATIKVLFRIVENNNGSNTGPVVLSIPIHDNLTTEYISDMTLLGDKAVNNADWEYDDSGDSYTLTYTANEGHFPPGTESYIGFIFEFEASENQKGKIPVKTTVQGNTAGDTLPNNDVDQDSLIYNNLK